MKGEAALSIQWNIPDSAPSRGLANGRSFQCGWFSEADWFSPKLFHPHARNCKADRFSVNSAMVANSSRCVAGDIYPHRLRHSLPSSMALQDNQQEEGVKDCGEQQFGWTNGCYSSDLPVTQRKRKPSSCKIGILSFLISSSVSVPYGSSMWMSHGGSAITTANFPKIDTSK